MSVVRPWDGNFSSEFSWAQWEKETLKNTATSNEKDTKDRTIFDRIRRMNVKDTRCFDAEGFFLDLSYITPNLIAAARPTSSSFEKTLLNPVEDLVKFMKHRHNDNVLLVNLIAEANSAKYPFEAFPNVTQDFAFMDRHPPALNKIQNFCTMTQEFLRKFPLGAVMVHCEDGRSRTAIMICSYLLFAHPQDFQVAETAIKFFDRMRMKERCAAFTRPSQVRYVSYFSQRFGATPGGVRLSRIALPNDSIRMSKVRVVITKMVAPSADNGFTGEVEVFSSKGRQMGGSDEADFNEYLVFDLTSDKVELCGDIRLTFLGRKYALWYFEPLFQLCINTGFVDHTPTLYDRACLDPFMPAQVWGSLPEDFHVQLLFRDKPKVSSDSSASLPAQVYCWDCPTPYLTQDESDRRHLPSVAFSPTGLPDLARDGPLHRFHALLDEECSMCQQRLAKEALDRNRLEMERAAASGTGGGGRKGAPPRIKTARDRFQRDLGDLRTEVDLNQMQAFERGQDTKSAQQLLAERIYSIRNAKRIREDERRRYQAEMDFGLGTQGKSNRAAEFKAGRQPFEAQPPSVYCPELDQYVCSWCSKHKLSPEVRRFAHAVVDVARLHYSGAARQKC